MLPSNIARHILDTVRGLLSGEMDLVVSGFKIAPEVINCACFVVGKERKLRRGK